MDVSHLSQAGPWISACTNSSHARASRNVNVATWLALYLFISKKEDGGSWQHVFFYKAFFPREEKWKGFSDRPHIVIVVDFQPSCGKFSPFVTSITHSVIHFANNGIRPSYSGWIQDFSLYTLVNLVFNYTSRRGGAGGGGPTLH